MRTLDGIGSTPRSGVGAARWYRPDADLTLPDRPDPESVDVDAELERYEAARDAVREALRDARDRTAERVGEDEAAVFEAHEGFLDDPTMIDDVEAAIRDGTPAAHAVADRFDEAVAQFEGMEGRMAERADDLRDVRDRLLRALLVGTGDADATSDSDSGESPGSVAARSPADLAALPEGTVLLAERLTPSDTAALDPDAVAGIATVEGGRTSHAAIIARSLAIPAVVGVGADLESIAAGETLLVDGEAGTVVVDPDEERRAAALESGPDAIRERVETADGRPVEVAANVGGEAELAPAAERGADGIGLFRTEFLFVDREAAPTEDEQFEAVAAALSAFPDDRVVVRTLDVGGDKPVPYLDLPDEPNPFLGRRGIRLSLDEHADLFETQVRALLRAAATDHGDGLAVMFPLVTRVEEVERAVATVESVAADLADEGVAHAVPALGAMVETPAAAFLADALADRLDFLSVGTNDLAQYVMAADRGNDAVADHHDPLHPAVLRALDRTTAAVEGCDAWVGMCGEMAGDPALTDLLLGLGFDELSMSAVTVPDVKRRVREVDADAARSLATDALACETRAEVLDVLGLDERGA
ncbi:phosphoenolpyruvate-protein phosphotransferase [Halorubrum coriense DSM 10284]|uniref:Phosphoenolpyruvate-protein phosphotransferase n=1 Tax=Halorubrum coriense DSM 10284 TaxID=1227466 RepID=M0ED36_9EURY|nr:phosphoenolpyruvate--protein phosphotransferase [Halorubrum coriense]ELZ45665.1 phosphoenolpyruvate-protein phosphotransferase [Halorubrum coriense DSM 10284]